MSAEAVTVVLHHSKSEGAAKLVLWGIANHHSDHGAWPSIATLAKYANIKERRVQQIIRELALMGEIAIQEQGGLGQHQYKTNRYHILIQCPSDCDGSLNHKTGVQSVTSGVQSSAIRGAIWSQSGVQPTAPEPNKELNNKLTVQSKQFDEFWNVYPRKEGKKPAFKAFSSALSRTSFEDILAGIEAYKRSDRVAKGYIKLPATWLNEDAWEDAATQVQTESVGSERRERERAAADKFLAEQKEQEKLASGPSKCTHGKNLALCLPCSKLLG
jgi:hypothetical protein